MLSPPRLLSWTAILCWAVNAEPLASPRAGRMFLNTSASTNTLQQYTSTTPSTILSTYDALEPSYSLSLSSSNIAAVSPSSRLTSTAAPEPLAPQSPSSLNFSTTQISGGSSLNTTSLPSPTSNQKTGGEIGDPNSKGTVPTDVPHTVSSSFPSAGSPTSMPGFTPPGIPRPPSVTYPEPSRATDCPPSNGSSTGFFTSKYYNTTSAPYQNMTTTLFPQNTSTSTCTPYTPGETITVFSVVPNTHTTTITLYGNQTNSATRTPEFTPPPSACPYTSTAVASSSPAYYSSSPEPPSSPAPGPISQTMQPVPPSLPPGGPVSQTLTYTHTGRTYTFTVSGSIDSTATLSAPAGPTFTATLVFTTEPASTTGGGILPEPMHTSTVIITSKNPVTVFTQASAPHFPGGLKTDRQTAVPTNGFVSPQPGASGGSGSLPGDGEGSDGSGVSGNAPADDAGTGSGGSGVSGPVNAPGTVLVVTTGTGGGLFREGPTPTVVDGITLAVGSNVAVIGGSTFAIGAGASQQTIVTNGEPISIGPGGVGFPDMTITPAASLPTNVIFFGGEVFSAVGASVAVFEGSSITYTGGTPLTTEFNGEAITIGPDGVIDEATTLGGPQHPTGTQLGIAGGFGVTEIGSSLAVIDGTPLAVGPDASETTATIDGRTFTATDSGLIINGATTLSYPFNPSTQAVTAGGITFSEIGASMVNIGGTTYTIGPGATTTTEVYGGQTISIGPDGLGFATTTISSFASESTPATTSKKKKNGGSVLMPCLWGVCIAFSVGILI